MVWHLVATWQTEYPVCLKYYMFFNWCEKTLYCSLSWSVFHEESDDHNMDNIRCALSVTELINRCLVSLGRYLLHSVSQAFFIITKYFSSSYWVGVNRLIKLLNILLLILNLISLPWRWPNGQIDYLPWESCEDTNGGNNETGLRGDENPTRCRKNIAAHYRLSSV